MSDLINPYQEYLKGLKPSQQIEIQEKETDQDDIIYSDYSLSDEESEDNDPAQNFFTGLGIDVNRKKIKDQLQKRLSNMVQDEELQKKNVQNEKSNINKSTQEKIEKILNKKQQRNQKYQDDQPQLVEEEEVQNQRVSNAKSEKPKEKKQNKLKNDKQINNDNLENGADLNDKSPKQKQKSASQLKTFQQLGLVKLLLKACSDNNFNYCTQIQQLAIPAIIQGRDVLASSVTGSGKTAAFLLPILQKYYNSNPVYQYSKVLIVIPTRELAIQCYEMLQQLNVYTRVTSCLIIGAVPIAKQEAELRRGPEIIISTPGRLIDLINNSRSIDLDNIEVLIFDEADKLMELGFDIEIKEIVKNINPQRQTLLFSATLNHGIQDLIKLALKNPVKISADPDRSTSARLRQEVVLLKELDFKSREACMLYVASQIYNKRSISFFKTKKQCHRMAILYGLAGLKACELHGNLTQAQRVQAFEDFKQNKFDHLLATDLASRGLDIKEVKSVINFELPIELTRYIHRIGRTARIGNTGVSLTLCDEKEIISLKRMIKSNKDKIYKKNFNISLIKQYRQKIEDMEHDVQKILKEENWEKEMKYVERDAQKAENLIKYQEDIYNRPKRKWIQSKYEKESVQQQQKVLLGIEESKQQIQLKKDKKNEKWEQKNQYKQEKFNKQSKDSFNDKKKGKFNDKNKKNQNQNKFKNKSSDKTHKKQKKF